MKECGRVSCSKSCWITWFRVNKLLVATLCAVTVGIILGLALRSADLSPDARIWIKLWGELFLRMLKFVVLPMVITCLVTGVSSLEGSAGGKLGAITLSYIFGTHFISVALAAVFALIFKPGLGWYGDDVTQQYNQTDVVNGTIHTDIGGAKEEVYYTDIITDFIRNLFPDNFIKACVQNVYTVRKEEVKLVDDLNVTVVTIRQLYRDGTNTIGIIVVSLAIGFALSVAGKEGKPLLHVFQALMKVVFILMKVIVWYSPFAIISLIASSIIDVKDLEAVMSSVAIYLVTYIVACVVHQFIIMPLLYLVILRKNPFKYYFYLLEGILAGVGPPSSAVGVPVMIPSLKDKLHIDDRIVDFVMPIEMTINRNGSVIYIVISVLFVANSYNISLGFGSILVVCILTSLLAGAVAAVPSSSVVLLITMLSTVNINMGGERLAIILALDWLNDRIRTSNNLASSGYGCAIIEKFCKGSLNKVQSGDEDNTQEALMHELSDNKITVDKC